MIRQNSNKHKSLKTKIFYKSYLQEKSNAALRHIIQDQTPKYTNKLR